MRASRSIAVGIALVLLISLGCGTSGKQGKQGEWFHWEGKGKEKDLKMDIMVTFANYHASEDGNFFMEIYWEIKTASEDGISLPEVPFYLIEYNSNTGKRTLHYPTSSLGIYTTVSVTRPLVRKSFFKLSKDMNFGNLKLGVFDPKDNNRIVIHPEPLGQPGNIGIGRLSAELHESEWWGSEGEWNSEERKGEYYFLFRVINSYCTDPIETRFYDPRCFAGITVEIISVSSKDFLVPWQGFYLLDTKEKRHWPKGYELSEGNLHLDTGEKCIITITYETLRDKLDGRRLLMDFYGGPRENLKSYYGIMRLKPRNKTQEFRDKLNE